MHIKKLFSTLSFIAWILACVGAGLAIVVIKSSTSVADNQVIFDLSAIFPVKPTPTPTPKPRPSPTPTPTPSPTSTPTPKKAATNNNGGSNTNNSVSSGKTYDDGYAWAKSMNVTDYMVCNQFKQSHGSDFVYGCGIAAGAPTGGGTPSSGSNSGGCCAGHGGPANCTTLGYFRCNDDTFDHNCSCIYVAPAVIPSNPTTTPPPIGTPPPVNIPSFAPIVVDPLPKPSTTPTTPPVTPPYGWHVD